MTTILCPTRGGQASYPNQEKAIELARQREAHLVFLYVYNIQFLHSVSSPVIADIEEEMGDLGEFLLAMAQEKAEMAGVLAEGVVRHGVFRHAVKDVIREKQVDTVVIGSAATPEGYTDANFIQNLVNYLQADAQVEVLVLSNGEITAEYPPPSQQGPEAS